MLTLLGLLSLGFVLFCVYFIFKSLEFVVRAIDLYQKMIAGNEEMTRLLLDIRDGTKAYAPRTAAPARNALASPAALGGADNGASPREPTRCPNCGKPGQATTTTGVWTCGAHTWVFRG